MFKDDRRIDETFKTEDKKMTDFSKRINQNCERIIRGTYREYCRFWTNRYYQIDLVEIVNGKNVIVDSMQSHDMDKVVN